MVAMKERLALVVLGMHRSGTSAVARMLSLLGARLPKDPPAVDGCDTPLGFWQPDAIYHFNDTLLGDHHLRWDTLAGGPLDLGDTATLRAQQRQAAQLLRKTYGRARLIVLKEPRLCRLWQVWGPAFAALDIETRFVLPVRHPAEVARSLHTRHPQLSLAHGVALWLEHVLAAERATRGQLRCIVNYESLVYDWRGVLPRLDDDLQIAWPTPVERVAPILDAFFDPAHRHCHHRHESVTAGLPWVEKAYGALQAAAQGRGAALSAQLDAIAGWYGDAAQFFLPVLRAQHARAVAERQGIEARHAALQAHVAKLHARMTQARGDMAALRAHTEQRERLLGQYEAAEERMNPLLHYAVYGASRSAARE